MDFEARVLILILLEVGLLFTEQEFRDNVLKSLNPYSTGSWVAVTIIHDLSTLTKICLNPYSTGSWVAVFFRNLVNMKNSESLNPYSTGSWVAVANYLYG